MPFSRIVPAFFLVFVFASPALADRAAIDDLIGKTWNFKQGQTSGTVSYKKNSLTVKIKGGQTLKGKLRINGDQMCTKYAEIRNGRERCFGVSKKGDKYVTTAGGTLWK